MGDTTVDIAKSKYFFYIAILFVTILIVSNTVGVKLVAVGPFVFTGAVFIFPISYIFGDVLTEVYGYRASRKIIWSTAGALVLMSIGYILVGLGFAPRIALASITALVVGEFCNSYVLSRMKVWMNGRALWMRTIGSTIVGEGVDTIVFVTIAFYGTVPLAVLFTIIWSGYLFKVIYEVLATPITYAVVGWLKKAEGIDTYDRGISYNPFHLSEKI